MELFSEVYGCYYAVVAEILRSAPLTRTQAEELAAGRGYGESVIQLIPKLLGGRDWPLLEERDGLFHNRLDRLPVLPVTYLERAWLKALLADPRLRLFLSDEQLSHLGESLSGVDPLYRQEGVVYFDRFLDGDDYADPDYRRRFQAILAALETGSVLQVTYLSQKGNTHTSEYKPMRLEYSPRDDKFRIYALRVWDGRSKGCSILNLGRILDIAPSDEQYDGGFDVAEWRRRHRCAQPLLLQVNRERNGVERFMLEFSSYEKQSEYDEETGSCTVRLWYQQEDEIEVLIRLLGFGPVVRVLGPESFVALMRERVRKQAALLAQGKS